MTEPMVIEILVPLSVQDLWATCTTEEGLSQWWWPQFGDTTIQIDPRPFHHYRFSSDSAGIGVHGDYIVVEKYAALEFSWVWEDDGPPVSDHVRVTFTPRGRSTFVRITHTMTEATPVGRSDYLQGWHDTVNRLVTHHLASEVAARAS